MNSDKMIEIADNLFEINQEIKQLEKKQEIIKESIKKYLQKTQQKQINTNRYSIELTSRTDYLLPTPDDLRKLMGSKFASKYITEIVDKKVRMEIPPSMQNDICPVDKIVEFISVKVKK